MQELKNVKKMTPKVILKSSYFLASILLVLLISGCWIATDAASAPQSFETGLVAPTPITTITTTTETAQSDPVIEDTLSSATSESTEDNTPCFRCYDQIEMAKSQISALDDLIKKQNNLIRRKNKASQAQQFKSTSTKRPRQQQSSIQGAQQRTLLNNYMDNASGGISFNNKPIVVSTLRVARSANYNGGSTARDEGTSRNDPKNIDPALKQLKFKQKQQFNTTCKSLHKVQQCLEKIYNECLGDLHYHSQEVISTQWIQNLNCPTSNYPNSKPFRELIRSIPKEVEKLPYVRPISTEEAIKDRLDKLLGRPSMGVVLKPTFTRPPTEKFNSIGGASDQYQQQFNGDVYAQLKGRQLLNGNGVMEYKTAQSENQAQMAAEYLLIPGFFVLLLAIVTVSRRYFTAVPEKTYS